MLGVDACAQQALVRAPRRAELWSGAPRWADASVLGGRMLEAALVADLLVLSELQRVSSAPAPARTDSMVIVLRQAMRERLGRQPAGFMSRDAVAFALVC